MKIFMQIKSYISERKLGKKPPSFAVVYHNKYVTFVLMQVDYKKISNKDLLLALSTALS